LAQIPDEEAGSARFGNREIQVNYFIGQAYKALNDEENAQRFYKLAAEVKSSKKPGIMNYYQALSVHNCIRVVPVEPSRGRILDRNGVILADTQVSFDVMVVPQETKDKEKLFVFLADALNMNQGNLLKTFKKRMVASFVPVVVVEDVVREKAIVVEENKFRFPGLFIQVRSKRHYPFNETGAHVLGYVGRVNRERMEEFKDYGYTIEGMTGYTGLEEYYDNFLQ